MRRNGLIIGLVVTLFFIVVVRAAVQFGFPAFLFAQDAVSNDNAVGTHAAFVDVGGNLKIANMVKAKGGNKMTVMVNINATTGEINSILGAVPDRSQVIIRIVGVTYQNSSNPTLASDIAKALNGSDISNNTIVVFGNKVNNLNKEWVCSCTTAEAGAQYGAFYNEFKNAVEPGKYRPVPAPLDMYNSDFPDYKTFIEEAGVYNGVELVANVYDVGELKLTSYTEYPGNVVAFTEFGPDPAKSLQEHLTFFKSTPPPEGKFATTLVPDKCDPGTDKFLYYVNGNFYDADGEQIDPTTCDKRSGTRTGSPPPGEYYKRFIYPFYSNAFTTADLTKKLLDDYSMTCSVPADYETGKGGAGTIAELIQYQRSACKNEANSACLFEPSATFSVSSTGVNRIFGVLRNEDEAKWRAYDYSLTDDDKARVFTNRFESVEQWFGANNPPEDKLPLDDQSETVNYLNSTPNEINMLHQGPYYKLMPLYGQCIAQGEVLKASKALCDEWSALPENSGQSCSLVDRKVQGTGKTYGELYAQVGENYQSLCKAVFEPEPESRPTDEQIALTNDMSKVDLYQETAYRPAFLVLSTEVDDGKPLPSQGNMDQQIRSQSPNGSKHQVDFLVYHVPDTVTDFVQTEEYNHVDIITRTAQTFTPLEKTQAAIDQWVTDREKIVGNIDNPSEIPEIDCRSEKCNQKLLRALIDFINAYSASQLTAACSAPITEEAESGSRIGSQLAPNDTSERARQTMKNGDPIERARSDIEVKEYLTDGGVVNPRNPRPQTRIYNVTPHGFRTKYVADAFDAFFASRQQEKQFNPDGKYLTTFESIFGSTLDSNPDIASYRVPMLNPDGSQVVISGIPQFQQKEVRDEIALSNSAAKVGARIPFLAKVFNFSTRAIVQQIAVEGSNLLECAKAVADPKKNTEDFLLRCQTRGSTVGSTRPSSNTTDLSTPATEFESFEIQYWNGDILTFNNPPQLIVDAANAAAEKHGCDPYLVIATAHSESPSFTNHQTENYATARGVWQFTRDNWMNDAWKIPFYTHPPATKSSSSFVANDPGKFNCTNPRAETPEDSTACSRTNVYAAADAACRLLNAIGANGQYDSQANFVQAFSVAANSFNQYGRVWNSCPTQGEYVWRLWHALRLRDGETPSDYRNQRVNYGRC
jgi:hypothetical protein